MLRAIPYTPLWFGILLWVIFGGSISVAAVWWLYEDYLFANDSKPATGIVERLYTTTSHGRHGSTTTFHIAYHYRAGDLTLGCRSSIARASYSTLSAGESIPLLYIPADMSNNRIELPAEQNSVRLATWGLSLATLAIHLTGVFTLRYYIRQNRYYRFLLANGVSCQGMVDAVPYDLVGKNRVRRFYLTFTFTDSQGQTRTGRSWYLRSGDEVRWRPNNPVPVRFDPANSEKFTVELTRGKL